MLEIVQKHAPAPPTGLYSPVAPLSHRIPLISKCMFLMLQAI